MIKSLEKLFTEQEIIEAALLADPAIDDCVVLQRKTATPTPELVAYVVATGLFSPQQIESRLKAIPLTQLPSAYVPLVSLPLTATGEIDTQALISIDVLDADLKKQWEEKLQLLPEVEQVAVVVQEYVQNIPPLHLSDLLPQSKVVPSSPQLEVAARPQLPTLGDKEQRAAIANGGSLPEELNAPTTLPAALQRAAKQSLGQKIAYVQPDGTEITQSYAELLATAERILAGLRALGLKAQDKVIIQLELNQDLLPAFWGCILGGFIPAIVPVAPTYSEPGGAVDKLCSLWQLLDRPLILTCEALQKSVRSLAQWLPGEKLQVATIESLKTNLPDQNYHPSQPDDVAFFNLTSGSTGTPKCIMLTHRNLISRARGTNQLCQHTSEDIILNWLPFDHIGSISDWHLRCVYLGCQLIYATKEYVLSRPLNWLDAIAKYRITHSWAPNFAYALVNDALKQNENNQWDLSCVKALLTAGEAVSSKAVEDFIANLATYGFKNTAIRPAFGMAEMGSGITYAQSEVKNALRFHTFDKASLAGELVRVDLDHPNSTTFTDLGPVIPSVSIRIVNSENVILSEDTIGNLQVRGDAVSPGYYKNPTVNQEVFLVDGWFNTGDLGLIANGHLVVTGRAKETIIINGANYYNHEIESVVEALEGVEVSYTAACAVQSPSSATEKLAIFFNSPYSGDALLDLIKQIRDRVLQQVAVNPDYLIPVPQSAIPKTAIGKIQRSQLSKRFEAGEFDPILKQIDIEFGNANTLPDWFYRKIWRPKAPTTVTSATSTGTALVFLDNLGLGQVLCPQLRQNKQHCIEVEAGKTFAKLAANSYSIDPQNPDHYHQLLVVLATDNYRIDQMVHLGNYAPVVADISSLEMLAQSQEQGIYSLLFLVQAISKTQPSDRSVRLLVVSNCTQATSSTDEIACDRTPILGLINTIPQEIPQIECRHLDLAGEQLEINATHIWQELQVAQTEPEVAYRNGQRLIPRLEKIDILQAPPQEIPFQVGGMYVISGGLGGISVEIAKYLLKDYNAKLLLLGRTPLPARQDWEAEPQQENGISERIEAYLALEQLGGQIEYKAVDICDPVALQQVVEQAKSHWQCELNGVIHLAGLAPERLLIDETRASLEATLRPKIYGTWALHQLIKDQPHSLFIGFSSLASFFGGALIGAYAAANTFLESFTRVQREVYSLQSYCFAWSMWQQTGMSRESQAQDLLRAKGYQSATATQGMQSLKVGLHHNQGQLLVGLDGSNRNIRRYTETSSPRRQILTAYFTTHQQIDERRFKDISVSDRFGTPSPCHCVKIQEMPLTETGEIDRDKLTATGARATAKQVAPRTEIESQLVAIWKKVLSVAQVGIHDNFFELGGSSVLAAQLFTQINEVIGQNLPLATLFQAPTVEKLASLLSQEEWSASWSSLVAIQPNGSKPPFFCIHGAGGNVLMYRKLAEYLGSDQPVYGLQAKGMDGIQDMLTQVEDIAAHYVKEIRAFQPEGPYFLGGLSFGGIASIEIAQRLIEQGQKVGLIALIDTHGPGYPKLLPIGRRLVALLPFMTYQFGQRLKYRISNYFNPKPKQTKSDQYFSDLDFEQEILPSSEQSENHDNIDRMVDSSRNISANVTSFKGWLENLTLWSLKFTPWAFVVPRLYLSSGNALPNSLQRVREANVRAMLEYAPQPYSEPIALFRATQQPPGCYKDPQLGWGKIATGSFEIYDIPGYHSEGLLTNDQTVQQLAKLLKDCLHKAQVEN